ncbi:integration host factor, actinobacterial type [Brevibacterium daeguense]|uniref:Integration host factor, actinobacterial type n=1 Tax=Brevibacterium daeguense TaxID=909936 RepID=A0ABP8EN49_9MICO
MALEPLTPEQRSAALDKAFKARQARAEVKTALKSGRTTLSQVLSDAAEDEALSKMKVHDLLRSLPGVGDRRATALMEEIGIASSRRLKGLGVHQTAALLEKFDAK